MSFTFCIDNYISDVTLSQNLNGEMGDQIKITMKSDINNCANILERRKRLLSYVM